MLVPRHFLRQLGLVKPQELTFPITVIGAGGIGSWAVLSLAKMGCSDITVIDFDKVENKNTPSQIYTVDQRGMDKVAALKSTVKRMTGVTIKTANGKFQDVYDKVKNSEVIICGVDSLKERRSIWEKITTDMPANLKLYIDARMGGEFLRILTVNSTTENSFAKYTKMIMKDSKPHEEDCTARSIVYNTFICGGLISSVVKKYAKQQAIVDSFAFDIGSLYAF